MRPSHWLKLKHPTQLSWSRMSRRDILHPAYFRINIWPGTQIPELSTISASLRAGWLALEQIFRGSLTAFFLIKTTQLSNVVWYGRYDCGLMISRHPVLCRVHTSVNVPIYQEVNNEINTKSEQWAPAWARRRLGGERVALEHWLTITVLWNPSPGLSYSPALPVPMFVS